MMLSYKLSQSGIESSLSQVILSRDLEVSNFGPRRHAQTCLIQRCTLVSTSYLQNLGEIDDMLIDGRLDYPTEADEVVSDIVSGKQPRTSVTCTGNLSKPWR